MDALPDELLVAICRTRCLLSSDLAALCLVSRRFQRVARERLYLSISLCCELNFSVLHLFLRTLIISPWLVPSIKHLRMDFSYLGGFGEGIRMAFTLNKPFLNSAIRYIQQAENDRRLNVAVLECLHEFSLELAALLIIALLPAIKSMHLAPHHLCYSFYDYLTQGIARGTTFYNLNSFIIERGRHRSNSKGDLLFHVLKLPQIQHLTIRKGEYLELEQPSEVLLPQHCSSVESIEIQDSAILVTTMTTLLKISKGLRKLNYIQTQASVLGAYGHMKAFGSMICSTSRLLESLTIDYRVPDDDSRIESLKSITALRSLTVTPEVILGPGMENFVSFSDILPSRLERLIFGRPRYCKFDGRVVYGMALKRLLSEKAARLPQLRVVATWQLYLSPELQAIASDAEAVGVQLFMINEHGECTRVTSSGSLDNGHL